jgi:hypothetical protein
MIKKILNHKKWCYKCALKVNSYKYVYTYDQENSEPQEMVLQMCTESKQIKNYNASQ